MVQGKVAVRVGLLSKAADLMMTVRMIGRQTQAALGSKIGEEVIDILLYMVNPE
jgi:hypothetical protein